MQSPLGGPAGEVSFDSGGLPWGAWPSSGGHRRLTLKVAWDKLGFQLNVIICFVLVLDHQNCVHPYKYILPPPSQEMTAF